MTALACYLCGTSDNPKACCPSCVKAGKWVNLPAPKPPRARQPIADAPASPIPKSRSRGKHRAGEMNKLERFYADELTARVLAGQIKTWKFEAITLVLTHPNGDTRGTKLTPDFAEFCFDGSIVFTDTKGYEQEDARIKMKVAATLYPMFGFRTVKRVGGTWVYEWFSNKPGE